jgi:putative spermidine/putrescine transport system substrate-binding protein
MGAERHPAVGGKNVGRKIPQDRGLREVRPPPYSWRTATGCSGSERSPGGRHHPNGLCGGGREKFTRNIIEPFREKFPNVRVTHFDGGNSAHMVGLLRGQRNDPQIDVAIIDASVTASINQEGLFEPLTDAEMPNLRDLQPEATSVTKGFGPACTFDSYCLMFDTSRVQLHSLSQWWEPANRELLGFSAPPNIQGNALTLLVKSMMKADYKTRWDDTARP